MIYIRKIYSQDIDANHQMQVVKEPAYSFFNFPYNTTEKNLEDKPFTLHFENFYSENGVKPIIAQPIPSRIYQSSATKKGKTTCEARLGSDLRNYLKSNLQFEIGDILVLRNKKGKADIDYSNIYVDYVSSRSPLYQAYNTFLHNENHCVALASEDENHPQKKTVVLPLQQIYYGAPGTGKSHATNEVTSKYHETVRTTFHPDSDYSTFVGAYKPTMTKVRKAVVIGQDEKEVRPLDCNSEWEEKITYKFVKQAFLKAYVKAWKLFRESCTDGQELKPQFLVIEEINRGNCAQIFGDLFQLLDRKQNFSEYPIEADEDIRKALLEADSKENPSFGENGLLLTPEQIGYVNQVFDKEGEPSRRVAEKICNGQVLVLPPNLFIWATMNTSDQSLFPIDSAFKRRWDWKYVPISRKNANFKIEVSKDVEGTKKTFHYDWWEFLDRVNTAIGKATSSEDKKLGYFFCKASKKAAETDKEPSIITADTFVGKVVFYLWNDVFKDYEVGDAKFHYGEDDLSLLSTKVGEDEVKREFSSFFDEEGNAKHEAVAKLLDDLQVEAESVD